MSNLALNAAAHSMHNDELRLADISNNLANLNTTAYKKGRVEFADLMYQEQKMIGADPGDGSKSPGGVQIGNGSQIIATTPLFTQGDLNHTARDLDVAIEGIGFFKVEHPSGEVYSRDGSWRVNSEGDVVTSGGYKVSGLPNLKNYTNLFISDNGEITVQYADRQESYKLSLYRVPSPTALKKLGNNLYGLTAASGEAQAGEAGKEGMGHIRHQYLEASNVKAVDEMVSMIAVQRGYEIKAKVVQTADHMEGTTSQLKPS
jgi:flagellar basal-body rod protein FlgG